MPLPEPTFDNRKYREILAETLARIPVHTPQWTNYLSDSDPGTTILQLVSFIGESVIYRASLIPDRNRQKFLKLLGIPLEPARPAHGLVTFNPRPQPGRYEPVSILPDDEIRAGRVPFRPERGLLAFPIESRAFYKRLVEGSRRAQIQDTYSRLFASVRQPLQDLDFYETTPLETPSAGGLLPIVDLSQTVDRSLWLVLLAPDPTDAAKQGVRDALGGRTISVGITPSLDASGKVLYPAGPPAADNRPRLVYEVPDTSSSTPAYTRVDVAHSDDVLSGPGIVELRMPPPDKIETWDQLGPLESGVGGYPPALENPEEANRVVTWIRVRSPQPGNTDTDMGGQSRIAVSWAGINATRVVQRTHIEAERLPNGTGEPDQTATLANRPVITDNVRLTVNGEAWTRIDHLSEAGPEVPPRAPLYSESEQIDLAPESKVYTVDRESGEILFGDGARGARPPFGALLLCSYDYGGGLEGLVGVGSISRGPQRLAERVEVFNPVPTWGAAPAETVADGEKRIGAVLRHRNVLNTSGDYDEITRATPGVNVGRVDVLPLIHPDLPLQTSEGVVTIVVVPNTLVPGQETPEIAELITSTEHERLLAALEPDRLFLETICQYLEPRRILTTELHIRGPHYVPVAIGVGILPIPGVAEGPLTDQVRRALLRFLSPLFGGHEDRGWPLNTPVVGAELRAAVARVGGVAQVTGLLLVDLEGNVLDNGLALGRLDLPRVAAVRVTIGAPPTAEDILGGAPSGEELPALPIPVAPEEC